MFGALHTFNSTLDDCGPSRFPQDAYEPGSGSTIMGYRGGVPTQRYLFSPLFCRDDLPSTDTYFHTASIEQIVNYTTFGNGSACAAMTNTGNNPPNIDAEPTIRSPLIHPLRSRRLPVMPKRTRSPIAGKNLI